MTEIQWDRPEIRARYEDMVSVLLSHIHPNAERINGSGGDGGRDVQLREGGRLDLFELKSFAGRVTPRSPSRRSQVERSLKRAAELSPDSWTLVVPINHNPSELEWFDDLRAQYPFPLHWSGLDWLNRAMSERPRVYKYFAEDRNAEVVELLTQLQGLKTVAEGGVTAAVTQMRRIQEQLNELDPYYDLHISPGTYQQATVLFPGAVLVEQIDDGSESWCVSVLPAYRGADRERPITAATSLRFEDTDEGRALYEQVVEILHFGANHDVTVRAEGIRFDGPQGLEAPEGDGFLRSLPAEPLAEPKQAQLRILDALGANALAGTTLVFSRIVPGSKGVTWYGHDPSGAFQLILKFSVQDRSLSGQVTFGNLDSYRPRQMLDALQVAHHFTKPNRVEIELADGGMLVPRQPVVSDAMVEPALVSFIEDVARVQAHTFSDFEITPAEFTDEDAQTLSAMINLMDGKEVSVRPNGGELRASDLPDLRGLEHHSFLSMEVALHRHFTRTFFGRPIALGICHEIGSPWRIFADPNNNEVAVFLASDSGSYRMKLGRMEGYTGELPIGQIHVSMRAPSFDPTFDDGKEQHTTERWAAIRYVAYAIAAAPPPIYPAEPT